MSEVEDPLEVEIDHWVEMTCDIVSHMETPSHDEDALVAATASALHLAGQAASILIPRVAPALALPILILDQASQHFEDKHQQTLAAKTRELKDIEQEIKDKLVTSIRSATRSFYAGREYWRIVEALEAHLTSQGVDPSKRKSRDLVEYAVDEAKVNGQKIIPSNKHKLREDVRHRYLEIFRTVRELHRAVSDDLPPYGVFAKEPYIRDGSELSEQARKYLGRPVELCRNPAANHKNASPHVRKGVCGDKGSDAVFEAYYIEDAQDVAALVSRAWPMAVKIKASTAGHGPNIVPNTRRFHGQHVELVAAERDKLNDTNRKSALALGRSNTDTVIDAIKRQIDRKMESVAQ